MVAPVVRRHIVFRRRITQRSPLSERVEQHLEADGGGLLDRHQIRAGDAHFVAG
jgi:hypothetical protein